MQLELDEGLGKGGAAKNFRSLKKGKQRVKKGT